MYEQVDNVLLIVGITYTTYNRYRYIGIAVDMQVYHYDTECTVVYV